MSEQNQNPYGHYGRSDQNQPGAAQQPDQGQSAQGQPTQGQPDAGDSQGAGARAGSWGAGTSSEGNANHQGNSQQWQNTGHPSHQAGWQQPGTGAGPYAQQAYDAYGNPIPSDARSMALFAHLSGLLGLVLTASFANFIGPFIFWLIYKDKPGYGFVRVAAAGAFNFSFTMWLVNVVTWIITFATFGIAAIFTWIILLAVWVALIVIHIIAAVKANSGEVFNYPLAMKVLK
ncbi:DUF4870 domain-containing protein [Rothia nasimurium]|uniref:DUF4870 domain-containing protein n=1 Tax=Rothia nasimurium TaxID=85336 RepID=UPI0009F4461F|nr:DUF4870 domain-containing protein [Rothia nasimurium]